MITIGCAIQKGGVGKTRTVVDLSCYLALKKHRVLLIDFDSQANATSIYEGDNTRYLSLSDYYDKSSSLDQMITNTYVAGLDLLPSAISLAKLEVGLLTDITGEGAFFLRDILESPSISHRYDYVVIDSPPSLGILTSNVLIASDCIIIPVNCEGYAAKGLSDFLDSIDRIKKRQNKQLEVLGCYINKYAGRTKVAKGIEEAITTEVTSRHYRMFSQRVRESVRMKEADLVKKPIFLYDPNSSAAKDFEGLCNEIEIELGHMKIRKHTELATGVL